MNRWVGVAIVAISLLMGCSFATEEELEASLYGQYPSLSLSDATYLIKVAHSQPIIIEAAEIDVYNKEHKAVITDGVFTQSDEKGNLLFRGSFGRAIVHTDNHNMSLEEGVEIHNITENLTINAHKLFWNNEQWTLTGDADQYTSIMNESGDILFGVGFFGDFAKATYEFITLEEGVLHYE
ncbi:MAG: hypothetical protein ACOX0W_04995 [Sphaerochaetaceae bacterium]|jgi:hypothetical protein